MRKLKPNVKQYLIVSILYILLIVWLQCYWWLLGLIVIFDSYFTKKVNWTFWKRRDGKNSIFIEWLDAIIFAVVIVSVINIVLFQNYKIPTPSMEKTMLVGDHLLVSKVAYGPRLPNTPIAMPFMQNLIPGTKIKSWSNLIVRPYKRAKGLTKLKRNDPFVFNFPAGDTVLLENSATSYYEIVRQTARELSQVDVQGRTPSQLTNLARERVHDNGTVIYRPVDRRDNYVKRCVAVAGDEIEIRKGVLYINGEAEPNNSTRQYAHLLVTNGTAINPRIFEELGISKSEQVMRGTSAYYLNITDEVAATLAELGNVVQVQKIIAKPGVFSSYIFPYDEQRAWNEDNFGPLWIPEKGATVQLDIDNICLYERIIDVFEENDLQIKDNKIFINGEESDSYTFKMNYYWAMGDNRHNSADSRYWGFVPEDHVVGKPKIVWLSVNSEQSGLSRVRFNRFLKRIK